MRIIISAIAMICAATMAFAISEPLLAIVLDAHGEPEDAIGISGAIQLWATVIAAWLATRILRRFTLRTVLVGGCATIVLLFLSLPLYVDAYAWIPARFVIGFLGTMIWIIGETLLNTYAPAAKRGRIMGIYGAISAGGIAAGPLILQGVGTIGWAPILAIVVAISCAGLMTLILPKTVRSITPEARDRGMWLHCMRKAPGIFLLCGVFSFSDFQIWIFLTLFAQSIGHAQAEGLNMLFFMALGGGVWPFIAGWLADRVALWPIIFTHIVLYIIALVALPFLAEILWIAYIISLMMGMVLGAIYTLTLVALGQKFEQNQLAGATSLFTMMWGLGAALGTALAGYVIIWFGYSGIFWLGAAAFTFYIIFEIIYKNRGNKNA
ncbi:MAG: MFS transporter [Pseudomonadota bacterium]